VRTLTSVLLLFLVALAPLPTAAASTACDYSSDATESLQLVREAYDLLEGLFVERLPSEQLLTPASQAVWERAAVDVPSLGDTSPSGLVGRSEVEEWPVFAGVYCAAWDASDVPLDALAYTAIRAMTRAVDEGHTRFLTPQMYLDHEAWAAGDSRYDGIGARLRSNPLGVQYVFPGSPADEAGLAFGDNIVAINGDSAADMSASDAVILVRGEAGTSVQITIERPGLDGLQTFDIPRARIRIPVIESRMIGDIAYLRLQGFPTPDLTEGVAEALREFRAEAAVALVLDLRGNTGGRLDVGTMIASYFLPVNAPVYQQTTRRGQHTTAVSLNQKIWDRPMVVLIDDATASMGEILASALQEGSVATLIGRTTAGAVAGSIVVPLSDGSAVQVTTLRIDSGRGELLNNIGVHPDVEIAVNPDDVRAGRDEVLDVGLDRLRTQLSAERQTAGEAPAPAATSPSSGGVAPVN